MAGSFKEARNTYLCMVQSVQIFGRPPKETRIDNPATALQKKMLDDYTILMTTLW